MTSVTVSTTDLRAALQSVAPHADTDPDMVVLHRVRLAVGGDVLVSATQRYSAGLAIASAWDTDGEVDTIDLTPESVKEILSLFKGRRGEGDDPGDTVRIDADDRHVTVTDSSGLFDGKSYRLLRIAADDAFPNLPTLLANATASVGKHIAPDRVVINGKLLGLFTTAARAYKEPLTIEPTGDSTALVIGCGESFLGVLMPQRPDDDVRAELDDWRHGWLRRLPEPPVDPEAAGRLMAEARRQIHRIDLTDHDQAEGDDQDDGGG